MERLSLLAQHTKEFTAEINAASNSRGSMSIQQAVLQAALAATVHHTDEHLARMRALQQARLDLFMEQAKLPHVNSLPTISTKAKAILQGRYTPKTGTFEKIPFCDCLCMIWGTLQAPRSHSTSKTMGAT
jgi:hypothetical protein